MSNIFFYLAGIVFLLLAKAKHTLQGYQTPKPFSLNETQRCIEYDLHIANRYIRNLASYAGTSIQGKRILELGPGSDLGCGLYLLHMGAASYTGFDRFDLAGQVPRAFYERLAERVPVDLAALSDGRINYTTREDFDVAAGVTSGIDIVFSNAAFEHFDDVEKTIEHLTKVVSPGGVIVAEIDLQTHSRWIRDIDPNNIYRYPEWLYRMFHFPGSPNRLRPSDYRASFEAHGWTNIEIMAANVLPRNSLRVVCTRNFSARKWIGYRSFCAREETRNACIIILHQIPDAEFWMLENCSIVIMENLHTAKEACRPV